MKDGDGKITTQDLGVVLRSVGQNPTEKDLATLLEPNHSGLIDFEEFCKLVQKQASKYLRIHSYSRWVDLLQKKEILLKLSKFLIKIIINW